MLGFMYQITKKTVRLASHIFINSNKNGIIMARPCKLTPDITQLMCYNISLGLTDALAGQSADITYQTFNDWMVKVKIKIWEYFEFYKLINKCNVDATKKHIERLKEAVEAGNCQVCMWIWRDISLMIMAGMDIKQLM